MMVTNIVTDVRFMGNLSEKRRLPSYTLESGSSSASEGIPCGLTELEILA